MLKSRDMASPSEFKGKTSQFIQHLKASGQPIVLTVNGKAEVVVHDAQSYEKLLELVDRLEAIEAIREGLHDEAEGRVVSLEEARASASSSTAGGEGSIASCS
jgi:PHD/YefM family antitoxin component YafN of YafNO toxin-antitoxin module